MSSQNTLPHPAAWDAALAAELEHPQSEEFVYDNGPARLAVLRVSQTPVQSVANQVMIFNNTDVALGWRLGNAHNLQDTDPISRLRAVSNRWQVTIDHTFRHRTDEPWLRRFGLDQFHFSLRRDIILIAGDHQFLFPDRPMVAMTLVLGGSYSRVMITANAFWQLARSYLLREDDFTNPVTMAVETLTGADPVWSKVFGPDTLQDPKLPSNMYFLLAPPPLEANCADYGRECIHFKHLQEVTRSTAETRANAPGATLYDHSALEVMDNISRFWEKVSQLQITDLTAPNIVFMEVKDPQST